MSGGLKSKVAGFPEKPGIYFFRDAAGKILYIGKARSLRDRVRSYFLPDPDVKIRNILRETADIDYLLTGSEKEAVFLESNYIQQVRPKFNLRLKDDKSFPYLKLTVRDDFPGIYFSRKVERDGSKYFGPFSPASRARKTLQLVNKYFEVRSCEESVFRGRKRPCLEHDLKLCSGPCVGLISETGYAKDVEDAKLFLEGRTAVLTESLKLRMRTAADTQRYEEAARWRDIIRTLEDIKQKPRTISVTLEDLDAAGFARSGDAAALHLFFMRQGKIRDSRMAFVEGMAGSPDGKILANLLSEFYAAAEKPKKVLLPFEPVDGRRLQKEVFSDAERRTRMIVPKAGKYARLVELANRNAEMALHKREEDFSRVLHLARVLGMPEPPERIEGFDVSNTGGDESVGALVVFDGGVPNKDEYRRFQIRTVVGPNDVAALSEIVRRRYVRLKREGKTLPGLILVDGGKGQLAAAVKALGEAGAGNLPVISLAKREEIIFMPNRPEGIRLDGTAPALKLLQRIRDEAHRFAITFHRKRREKKSFGSELDGIPGLGPKRKAALLERIGGLDAVRSASIANLAAVIGRKAALTLISAFKKRGDLEHDPDDPGEKDRNRDA